MKYHTAFADGLFDGQTVIVTGGGSGIGRCTAHELARLGATVALVGRKAEKIEAVRAEIEEDGGRALTAGQGETRRIPVRFSVAENRTDFGRNPVRFLARKRPRPVSRCG